MIIDFHTHSFPDKIAKATIDFLAAKGNITPKREGTLSSLITSMNRSGVDYSVVLPVATSPKQVDSINRTAIAENGKNGIIYAGAIHPDCEDVCGILDCLKEAGICGIKIHPDYQGVYFDDDRYLKIMEAAAKRNLFVVTHAGLDIGYPDDVHCTPDRVLNVLSALKGVIDDKLVLAHLGSYGAPDEVALKLVGQPVYMDTAAILDLYPEKATEIIRLHGADKILFATDSPWADQKEYVDILNSMPLSDTEKEKIFSLNARKLLHLL